MRDRHKKHRSPGVWRWLYAGGLLFVIGIIAVLIGVLLPVISRARDAALTTQCASNLRDGLAVNQYLSDNHSICHRTFRRASFPFRASLTFFNICLLSIKRQTRLRGYVHRIAFSWQLETPGEVGPQRGALSGGD